MKLEQLRIPLIPRSTYDCLDLGVKFYGQHLFAILKLWFWVAAPTMLLIYPLVYFGHAHLGHALLLVFLVTGPWSVLLVRKAVQTSFGESFHSFPGNLSELRSMSVFMIKAFWVRILTLIGACFLVIPGWLVALRSSFFVEKSGLSDVRGKSSDRGTGRLVKQEIGPLFQRSLGIGFYMLVYAVSLFFTMDFLVETLFQQSLFWGRAFNEDLLYLEYESEYGPLSEFSPLLVKDPLVVTVECGILLLVYPIARLAWYFSYIDLRVRGDFWDLELRFQKEVDRLQEVRL